MNSTPVASLLKTSLALAVAAAVCSGSAMAASSANALVSVAHTTALHRGDAVIGALPLAQPVHIEVALKLRNRDALDAFNASNAKNQASGMAVQTMGRDQFLANHAPTQVQAQTVANYLASMGYRNIVIAPNRMLVSADGTAATASKAFLTSMAQVKTNDGRLAYANTTEARIPAALQDSILAVTGLQTVHVAHTFAKLQSNTGVHTNAVTSHNPVEFSSIYSATGVATAAGVTVGIFTAGDVAPTIQDLNTFTANNKLATVNTAVVQTNGGGSDTSGTIEWDLDSQDIVGMGGGKVGRILFYTAPTLSDSDMVANFNTIVNANAAKIVNVSIGGCETDAQQSGAAAAADQILAVGVSQGQTFSISTGDHGADVCRDGGITPSWPADSPYVVAASGTTLDASTTTWAGETVWNSSAGATGGSPSTFEPKPIWQYQLVPGSFRGVADIAFDADPNSGAVIILNGSPSLVGGTSLSAPLFSGMWARVLAVKGTGFGFAAPYIYALPQADFHDITVGNNNGESAKVGYDFATGRGSIILNTAIKDIGVPVGSPPVPNFSYVTHGLRVAFTDTSTDSDGKVVSHYWDFGDRGALVAGANPVHTFLGAGTYNVSDNVFDNSGNLRTKTKPVTVVPAGGASQLIANTGFETGSSPWFMSSGVLNNNNLAEPSHGGQWDAWMGGKGFANRETVWQQVSIPAGKTSANLTFSLHVDSNEITQTRIYDRLFVDVYSTGGFKIGQLAEFSNLDKAPGYAVHNYDMSPWIGKTVVLRFNSYEDTALQTSFVLDDVTLLVN